MDDLISTLYKIARDAAPKPNPTVDGAATLEDALARIRCTLAPIARDSAIRRLRRLRDEEVGRSQYRARRIATQLAHLTGRI